jgi:hypothetical protein
MMTPAEHYLAAEQWIAAAMDYSNPQDLNIEPSDSLNASAANIALQYANAHALLASIPVDTYRAAQKVDRDARASRG